MPFRHLKLNEVVSSNVSSCLSFSLTFIRICFLWGNFNSILNDCDENLSLSLLPEPGEGWELCSALRELVIHRRD